MLAVGTGQGEQPVRSNSIQASFLHGCRWPFITDGVAVQIELPAAIIKQPAASRQQKNQPHGRG
jgi:hypothetical protein